MIKKISDKDKKDWDSFLKKKKTIKEILNNTKNIEHKTIQEISDKNKQDWENFLKNKEKIYNKDFVKKKK